MKFALATIAALVGVATAVSIDDPIPMYAEEPSHVQEPSRELRIGTGAGTGISAGDAAQLGVDVFKTTKDLIPAIIGEGKNCHQLACWVGTRSYDCGMAGANQVQRELTRGRNSFAVEGSGESGMWVRYWRTMFTPPDRGDIAVGNCTDGNEFRVSNCQATGKVYC